MNRKTIFFCILNGLLSASLYAQQFGGNPSSLKWRQVNTDTARVIFPAGLDSPALRVAEVIHDLQKTHNSTIGSRLRKVNIVLQNQTTVSNAYVSLGPYRSEFYLIAPQNSFDLGSLNWADNLAIHEYRHVQQYSNFNVGLSKVMGILFGQEGQALANGVAVPDWFFEGDAVFNETSLSRQGRGRLPAFFNGYKSLMQSNRNFSYMKLRNGSLRHYVPGHYELGYLLVAYGREKYGADFWKKVSQDAASFKPLFYPWQQAVKKYSGINYRHFVDDAFNFYQSKWKKEPTTNLQWLTPVHKNLKTDYRYPYLTEDGLLMVLKSSYRQVPSFCKVTADGYEQKIAVRDISHDDYFSYNNGVIAYASLKPDARWSYREYSNIRLLDVATKSVQTITKKGRFFSPDIAHNGQMIAAVEMLTTQQLNLVIMDRSGKRLLSYPGDDGIVYTYPKFSADDNYIYTAVRNKNGQMALQKINIGSPKQPVKNLLQFGYRIIGFPVVQGDTIFFSSSYNGHDEIWAYIESAANVYRVASNSTGFYQAVMDRDKHLVTSHFTSDGYRLAAVPPSALLWQKVDINKNALPDLYVAGALQQEDSSTLNQIPARSFATSKYRKTFHLFNFYSWRPYYDDPEISFSVFGQNILNTFQSEITYTYNRNEQSHKLGFDGIYGGWYVQPSAGISQTWNRVINYSRDTTLYYDELNANAGLKLPLNFSGGKQYRYLTLSTSLNTQQVRLTGLGKKIYQNQNFNYLQASAFYSSQVQKAVQHIYPRWAQTLFLQYRTIINKYTANQFLATGSVYLPGLYVNHNLVLTAAYHARDTMRQYVFSNNFPFSRGYTSVDFPRMWRFGANYHFPLFYPDWGFANIVYFQRIRANGFFDFTQTKSLQTGNKFFFKTTGAEIFFDTKWWNQQQVTFGVRYSHLLDREYRGATNPNHWEVILPVNLFND